MKRKAVLLFALILTSAGLLIPSRTEATCDPAGTTYLYYESQECNAWSGTAECNACPEQSYCIGGYFPPPTTCCNGYSIVYGTPDNNICYYCLDNNYVCN